MRKVKTVLIGLGAVNIGVLNILIAQRTKLIDLYDFALIIVGVADSTGVAVNPSGFDYETLVELKKRRASVNLLAGFLPSIKVENIVDHVNGELLIESSPGNLKDGEPGLSVVRNALQNGWAVVMANKAPLVFGFDDLHRLAELKGGSIAFSATVCGGLPVINVLQRDLKLARLDSLKGIFNATSNYVLRELERGGSFTDAIKEAQRLGAAEADPSHDVNGHDTANKLFIIMKSFTGFSGSIKDIHVEGIRAIEPKQLQEAKDKGYRIKLLATADYDNNHWNLSVRPTWVEANSFLGNCEGWEMGLEVKTDLYESISMKNYEADPLGTSAAVLRDVIDLVEKKKLRLM